MTVSPLRKDAARNWQHIVDTARRFVDDGTPLRLNDVARVASIGVATVYRHFPTPEALLETIARPALERLAEAAGEALAGGDPWEAFAGYLSAGIDAQLADAAVQPVVAATEHALPETAELVNRLTTTSGLLLDRVRAAGAVSADLTPEDVVRLMCGVVFAGSVHATPDERPLLTRRYLETMLRGLRLAGCVEV
ncbi:TetR family transcriptional regulator [Actinoplanes italicus]|uniref:TetR family transcriptional regulator n=1 Tax=Actinoplanes italicus TaxID=113567 RepID=A0A2T0JYQ7_9ACTN|nr:TetR/AcrR family transcriptional regulator [Actinoplanes italicus]PRX14672.1 TetR family transcriptional regulator [Actinoplanes italicus]GIE34535.1 TetR family transcriptional regulator [Actinoplanes italicus]